MKAHLNPFTPSLRLYWLRFKLLVGRCPGWNRTATQPQRAPPVPRPHRRARPFLELP